MRTKRSSWTFPTTCRRGHPYGPNPPRDERGNRLCAQCRTEGRLCSHCNLRPVPRKHSLYCSRACANSARLVPLAERFLLYYQPGEAAACWPWAGTRDKEGYGVIGDEQRHQIRAHRIAYERVHGPIPPNVYVLHRCDNPPCCNPAHLWLGSAADNNSDKLRKDRHPHEYKRRS